ncbi:MAG TPA: GtrA family protein [Sphingomonas sp.]|nr:GtrA family protein [Sphingomonas sp.]
MRALFQNEAVAQLLRFAVAGVGVTAFSVVIYLFYAMGLHADPLLANAVSHVAGVALGYSIHSRWSFRESATQDAGSLWRFAIASVVAFALNSLWVWLGTSLLALPAWAPVPAMVFVTPLTSFALNRWWVFSH